MWLARDFNLWDIVWSGQSVIPGSPKVNISKELINIAADFGPDQVVYKLTRGNRILGLFSTTNSILVIKSTMPAPPPVISDHDGIPTVFLNTSVKRSNKPPRKIYPYQRANTEDLKAEPQKISKDFGRKNLSETNANNFWNEFKDRVQNSVEKNVPSKIVWNRTRSPWIN